MKLYRLGSIPIKTQASNASQAPQNGDEWSFPRSKSSRGWGLHSRHEVKHLGSNSSRGWGFYPRWVKSPEEQLV